MSQYDESLARGYHAAKQEMSPLQRLSYTGFMEGIGNVSGLKVADFGCGTGVSTRLIADRRPFLLAGYDNSEGMLRFAIDEEDKNPRGITYGLADLSCPTEVCNTHLTLGFDVVTAMWLLHYAETRSMLGHFAKNIYNALVPGGRLVAIVQDKFEKDEASKAYGEWRQWIDSPPYNEGNRQRIFLLDLNGTELCNFLVHFWSRESYREALAAAGFTDILWSDLRFPHMERVVERLAGHDLSAIERCASCSLLTATRPSQCG